MSGLYGRPTAAELVAAVADFLDNDVRSALRPDGRPVDAAQTAFHTRVAVNVLRTVERELRDARLPSGGPAFGDRELRHMRDVRRYVLGLYLIHAIGIAGLGVLGLCRRTRRVVRDAAHGRRGRMDSPVISSTISATTPSRSRSQREMMSGRATTNRGMSSRVTMTRTPGTPIP